MGNEIKGSLVMRKVLVDSDVVIDFLRQPKKETLLRALLEDKKKKIFIAAVSITELWKGKSVEKKEKRQRVERFLKKVKLVVADRKISQQAGDLLRKCPFLMLGDSLIAATCLVKGFRLATFNKKHFQEIKNLKFYSAEWKRGE